jgi:hypothetical protein
MRYNDSDFGGALDTPGIAGPLIGGGVAQVGTLAAKLLFQGKAPSKWAGLIGAVTGAAVGAGMMFTRHRDVGISALVTALLIGVPRQLEDLLAPGSMSGYGLGVITPTELAAWGAEAEAQAAGQPVVQLLSPGSGMGIHVPETLDGSDDMGGPSPVEMLGGFGSNFMNAQ